MLALLYRLRDPGNELARSHITSELRARTQGFGPMFVFSEAAVAWSVSLGTQSWRGEKGPSRWRACGKKGVEGRGRRGGPAGPGRSGGAGPGGAGSAGSGERSATAGWRAPGAGGAARSAARDPAGREGRGGGRRPSPPGRTAGTGPARLGSGARRALTRRASARSRGAGTCTAPEAAGAGSGRRRSAPSPGEWQAAILGRKLRELGAGLRRRAGKDGGDRRGTHGKS